MDQLVGLAREWLSLEREKFAWSKSVGVRAASSAVASKGDSAASTKNEFVPIGDTDKTDPNVFKIPRGWKGQNFEGVPFSQTTPEFLQVYAAHCWERAEYQDANNKLDKNGKPASQWSRLDARRALRWAERLKGQQVQQVTFDDGLRPDELPF